MKFRIYGMVLSLFFALGLVFSFGIEASAHEGNHSDGQGITADRVDPAIEDNVKALLSHIIDYYNQEYRAHPDDQDARTRAVVIFGRQIRIDSEDGGLYKDGDVYSMAVNESDIVTNHSGHPSRFGYEFVSDAPDSAIAGTLKTLTDRSTLDGDPVCEPYGQRWACATKVQSDLGPITVIAGLDHAEDDSAFMLPDCSDFMLDTTAQDVYESQSDTDLEALKSAIGVVQQQVKTATDANCSS